MNYQELNKQDLIALIESSEADNARLRKVLSIAGISGGGLYLRRISARKVAE